MSVVTNVILCVPAGEHAASMKHVNDYLGKLEDRPTQLKLFPEGAEGGTKYLEVELWIGAFNHLDVQSFIDAVSSAPWEDPEIVQLLIQEQDEDVFTDRFPRPAKPDRSALHHAMELARMQDVISMQHQKLTAFQAVIANTIIDLEEGGDALKVADDLHEALGGKRMNGTEE